MRLSCGARRWKHHAQCRWTLKDDSHASVIHQRQNNVCYKPSIFAQERLVPTHADVSSAYQRYLWAQPNQPSGPSPFVTVLHQSLQTNSKMTQ